MLYVSLALLLPGSAAFSAPGLVGKPVEPRASVSCRFDQPLSRRDFGALSASAGLLLLSQPALAESTLVTRQQSYTRYVPRVERGRDYWANGLRKQIDNSDWKGILAAIEKKGTIDRIFGPMELWSSSFSGKTITAKTLAMNEAIDDLRDAVLDLKSAALGKEAGGGFFGFGGGKSMDEGKRKQIANKAYQNGVDAINKYITLGNDGLGLNFTPLDTID